ncbi:callose synthase 9 [Phtheirospermum japonicum]|uniref:1,3-beta-glucan synthase n=1 Tax=Phtheirospermum japonicum TaxID=374723 RepID=A0A830B5Z2_9LAMI|nr:callose synthase 9 [Phtheirospermum japonicum]
MISFQILDEAAVQRVFLKSLDNYINWCKYLGILPVWSNLEAVSKEKKLLFIALYFLIWGEAANVRFLPECLCYIFHHVGLECEYKCCWVGYGQVEMERELEEILRQQVLQPANSCVSDSGVSFMDQVIHPLYEVISTLKISSGNPDNIISNLEVDVSSSLSQFSSSVDIPPDDVSGVLDIIMMYGAYSTSRNLAVARIFLRFLVHSVASVFICFLYVRALQEESRPNSTSVIYKLYVIVLSIYAGAKFLLSFLLHIPACHRMSNQCDSWQLVRFMKWMHQIRPLAGPTRAIVNIDIRQYSWHDFVSKNNHNALTIVSIWVPVLAIYLMDIHIFYTVISAIWGFLLGARDRLGEEMLMCVIYVFMFFNEYDGCVIFATPFPCTSIFKLLFLGPQIRSLDAVHQLFESFPAAFMKTLHVQLPNRDYLQPSDQAVEKSKIDAAQFAPFWNEIVKNLREEDYISSHEMELLLMPKNSGSLQLVQWPLFLLVSKIFLAKDIAMDSRDSQEELWDRISRDDYMKYAVEECFFGVKFILTAILDYEGNNEGKQWVEIIYKCIRESIANKRIHVDCQLNKLPLVIQKVTALLGILKKDHTPELEAGAVKAVLDLYDVMQHEVLSINMSDNYETWNMLSKAKADSRLFQNLKWPIDAELKAQVSRLYSLLTMKDSGATIPTNLEAGRRLEFFTNSLFMEMPVPRPVREMPSFSVFTPYYSETVLYSMPELLKKNEDGISTLFYLQKIYPDEWKNFLARIGRDENSSEMELRDNPSHILELRFWASYRGQTLARTVRGMMYYRKALMLQTYLERMSSGDVETGIVGNQSADVQGFELSPEARAQADLKFTYVVTCQIYGKQKEEQKPEAADIALLMQRNEALRVAFIDVVETMKDGKVHTDYFSKLVKADVNGKDKEIYSIKLPGNPKLGEGKPENQNHAIVFTRGNAMQAIDMNQDNYFEEALKIRNLLEEFYCDHGLRPPTILGVREHVFTGSVSSLASFMSNQEASFVTLGQRVLANPLKVRMHYGHPDVFDRVFHITRGGISKASRVINISEDIFSGFNSTLRQGNVTHHEYIQVGKGRDVGINQIALFEGKVAGGNGEQVLSRDVYRLGQLFDFFRMMSFYFTTVGYYFCTMALSGVGEAIQTIADVLGNTALSATLNAQFLFQIDSTVARLWLALLLCNFSSVPFSSHSHWELEHITLAVLFFTVVQGMEIVLLLVIILAYGYNGSGAISYILLTISSWFLALSWLFAPYLFNPSGFEWQKTVEDFRDWTNWLLYRGGIGVKGEESWEAWWDEELSHIRTFSGRVMETILSLRFFIFQYGVVYKLDVQGSDTALTVYGFSWVVFAVLIILFKVFTFSQKISVNFQLLLRFIQGVAFLLALAGLSVAIVLTDLTITDVFACLLAFLPTGWGILCIACAWKPVVKKIGLWKSIRSIARLYDAAMGICIFIPVAFCSWFPFVSTFQTRLMFNQAFSRGLEISLILAGDNPNSGI